jgi:hypothetical protein
MPVSAMTAPGGSITPSKHILGNQDAAATNFSRSGSAVRASKKNRQIGKRGAGGEAGRAPQSGSAAVVSEWDGGRHIVVLCAGNGTTLRSRNYSLAVRSYQ